MGTEPDSKDVTSDLALGKSTGALRDSMQDLSITIGSAGSSTYLDKATFLSALPDDVPPIELLPAAVKAPVMDTQRREMLGDQGLRGVSKMRLILAETAPDTVGFERERTVIKKNGCPDFQNAATILRHIQERGSDLIGPSSKPEVASSQIEHNSLVFSIHPHLLSEMDQYTRSYDRECAEIAAQYGSSIVSFGVPPSLKPTDPRIENLSASPRFRQLVAALNDALMNDELFFHRKIEGERGDVRVFFGKNAQEQGELIIFGPDNTLRLKNTSMLLEGVMTSMQVHVSVPDQSQYLGYHRVADMVAPALVALTASSPFLFDQRTGFADSRNGFLWHIGASPWRVGFLTRDWIGDKLEQLREAQAQTPLIEPSSGGKTKTDLDPDIAVAIEAAKTLWPHNRTTADIQPGGVTLRVENRVMSAGPTVGDEMAHLAFCTGLIPGLYEDLKRKGIPIDTRARQRLDMFAHFLDVRDNFAKACVDALDARVRWFHDSSRTLGELTRDVLLPAAKEGLLRKGLDEREVASHLNNIRERVEFRWREVPDLPPGWEGKVGTAPSDLIVYLDHNLRLQGGKFKDAYARGEEIALMIKAADQFDSAHFQREGIGCGILGWFRDEYLRSSRSRE